MLRISQTLASNATILVFSLQVPSCPAPLSFDLCQPERLKRSQVPTYLALASNRSELIPDLTQRQSVLSRVQQFENGALSRRCVPRYALRRHLHP